MNHTSNPFGKFLLLWSGELISAIGGGLTSFGLGVYVYQRSGMASHVSFVMLLAFLSSLLFSAPAGVLADHSCRPSLYSAAAGERKTIQKRRQCSWY